MLHALHQVQHPWSLIERSVFVDATGSHFASTVSIERLRRLNLPLAHGLHRVSFLQPLHRVRLPGGQTGLQGQVGRGALRHARVALAAFLKRQGAAGVQIRCRNGQPGQRGRSGKVRSARAWPTGVEGALP